jgi:UDP-N-acetylmuramoyl-L-alanyl-D-glutamate--2,6-diaminopimelate ligase
VNPRTVVKALIPKKAFKKLEPWGHLGEAVIFNVIYGFPAKNLKVIGVTGTNGKTTTAFMIHKMLHQAGVKTGLMTTVGYGVGDNIKPQIEHMTSVPMPQLMKRLKVMNDQGVEWLVLEVTSQALAQNRVWGVPFSLAVMTNVTHEHLDWHGSFANYRDAKRRLFKLANRNNKGLRTGVVNAEDPSAKLFESDISKSLTYGIKAGELRADEVKMTSAGSSYRAAIGKDSYDIVCHLPGSFNVYNSLAVVAVGRILGLDKKQIEQGIAALAGVEGRMNTVDAGQKFEVIVDYAHTPDSFEKLFKDLRPVVKGKMIVMFGSAGRRDEAKRAVQGELAGKYCDEIVITEEDDRDADGLAILEQIASGAKKAGKIRDKNLFLVHDRAEAIKFTLGRARAGDTVLLLGKGHEKNIERAHGLDDWDEVAIARGALKDIK